MKMFPSEGENEVSSVHLLGCECLRGELTRRQEPSEGEKIGGKSSGEDVESDGATRRWVELVRRVVLAGIVDISSPITSSDLQSTMGQLRRLSSTKRNFERTMIIVPSSSVSRVGYQRRVVM